MAKAQTLPVEALIEQSRTVHQWLAELPGGDFSRPTVLPGWDVRTLTGHLVLVHVGFSRLLGQPTRTVGVPVHEFVKRYRRDVAMIAESTMAASADKTGGQLVGELAEAIASLAARGWSAPELPQTIDTPRGPALVTDFLATRIVEVVVHADDLSRSLPERPPITLHRGALSICSRTLGAVLAGQHPGRSIEVRIPPFAAVQCGIGDPGPTHTRGTPPNVVETDALTFLRLATGRLSWDEAVWSGTVHASGLRADLSAALPLLS